MAAWVPGGSGAAAWISYALKNLLDFLGGDLGTDLMSLSKRGLHPYYAVDDEVAQKILTQAGQFLPGVDVRGGARSGGVLIETNGVCPHRRWVRGKPRIDYTNNALGVIVGVEDYGEVRFDDRGRCVSGPADDRLPSGCALEVVAVFAVLQRQATREELPRDVIWDRCAREASSRGLRSAGRRPLARRSRVGQDVPRSLRAFESPWR